MRYELEKTWEIEKRLATWKNNNDKFESAKKPNISDRTVLTD